MSLIFFFLTILDKHGNLPIKVINERENQVFIYWILAENIYARIDDIAVVSDGKDPLVTVGDSEDEDSEKDDDIIKPTDNLVLVGHIVDEASILEVYGKKNVHMFLYKHNFCRLMIYFTSPIQFIMKPRVHFTVIIMTIYLISHYVLNGSILIQQKKNQVRIHVSINTF